MPLVSASLASGLASVFKSQPDSGALAAQKMAAEYDKYCKAALAPPAPPIFTGAEVKALEGPLVGALASGDSQAAIVAQAWATGIQAYWLAPPVQFVAGPVTGLVTAMPGAMAIVPLIQAAFDGTVQAKGDENMVAQQIASALDTATKTVLVTFTTPPPPLGPPPPATVV